jgi:putative membrane protein
MNDGNLRQGEETKCESARGGKKLRVWGTLTLLVGIAVSIALIAYSNFSAVAGAVWSVGWGLGFVVAIQILCVVLNGFAWRILFPLAQPACKKILIPARWIRDALNYLLPSAVLGGEVVGVRLLVARGCDINTAGASVVADKTLEVMGLFLFVLTGIIIFLVHERSSYITHWAISGLVVLSAVLAAFLLSQRWGLLKLMDKVILKFAGNCGGRYGGENMSIHDLVWQMYADTRRLIFAAFLHTSVWTLGSLQIWTSLHFMGYKIGLQEAFMIESLCQVIIAAAFMMPLSLGAQEAAYMSIAGLFGIPPPIGLAVSLVQRLKELIVGIPGLLLWQGFEGSRLWTLLKGKRN